MQFTELSQAVQTFSMLGHHHQRVSVSLVLMCWSGPSCCHPGSVLLPHELLLLSLEAAAPSRKGLWLCTILTWGEDGAFHGSGGTSLALVVSSTLSRVSPSSSSSP